MNTSYKINRKDPFEFLKVQEVPEGEQTKIALAAPWHTGTAKEALSVGAGA